MATLERMGADESQQVQAMIQQHVAYTASHLGREILARWSELAPRFVKVMPKDYQRMLEALTWVRQAGLSGERAEMAAFEANKSDISRVSGN